MRIFFHTRVISGRAKQNVARLAEVGTNGIGVTSMLSGSPEDLKSAESPTCFVPFSRIFSVIQGFDGTRFLARWLRIHKAMSCIEKNGFFVESGLSNIAQ